MTTKAMTDRTDGWTDRVGRQRGQQASLNRRADRADRESRQGRQSRQTVLQARNEN